LDFVSGESDKASENKLLGKYVCNGIPPAPSGKGKVQVTYRIDSGGVLVVTGTPLNTSRHETMTFELLTREEKLSLRYGDSSQL